jgi:hypothetical protein
MKKALILVIAALAIPSVALAAKPSHPSHPTPMTTYVINGTLSSYTAYNSVGPVNGTISILVKHVTKGGKATRSLKGQTLTFTVDANTKLRLRHALTTITDGDRGLIKLRAAKHIPTASLAATLQQSPAKQIVDRGAPKP